MSSHREAPAISQDAVADSTDLYAFVSPDDPSTVTIIANYLPGEAPFGGPNFYEFGDDVLYSVNIDNDADGKPEIVYEFQFRTEISNNGTFLYNIGPITSLGSANWIRKQFYTVTRIVGGKRTVLGQDLACPPCNIGPGSTSDYDSLASAAIHSVSSGHTVFAGQRLDPFYVDLGSIFDLGDLRPLNKVGPLKLAATHGVDSLSEMNVQSIALKIPKTALTSDGSNPTNVAKSVSVIGVWTSASRPQRRRHDHADRPLRPGLAPGQPARQRGRDTDGFQGCVERRCAGGGLAVREVRRQPGAPIAPQRPLRGRIPPPGGAGVIRQASGGPRSGAADGSPVRDRPRVPEQHRQDAGRSAAPEHGDPAGQEAQFGRAGVWRRRRLSEWPPAG
jgi:hypothetical protein